MSVIGNSTPTASFKTPNDAVAGRIVGFEDYQEKEFNDNPATGAKKGDPKFYPNPGPDGKPQPVMGCRITLETTPGNEDSRVAIWAHGKRMLGAIRAAVQATGARDLEIGADLYVQFTGYAGAAKTYNAGYSRPEADSVPQAA